jgi:hypothetical protein
MESSGSMHASVWLEQEDFKSGAPGITQAGEDKGKAQVDCGPYLSNQTLLKRWWGPLNDF